MSNKDLSSNEENLNDPAWKPLKSKREIFEGVQNQPIAISNTEGKRPHSSSVSSTKRFEIETGIVEQRKTAVIESKEVSIDASKKTEPNIEAYSASSEAKHLKELLEQNNSTSSPLIKKNVTNKKEPQQLPPKPLYPVDNYSGSLEEINSLNSLCQEIENIIGPDNSEEKQNTKPLPKIKPNVPSKPNSNISSPMITLKKMGPHVPPKPSTPSSATATPNISNSPKFNKAGPPPIPIKNRNANSPTPELSLKNGSMTPKSAPVKKVIPPPPPLKNHSVSGSPKPSTPTKDNSLMTPNSAPVKKVIPPPPPLKSNSATGSPKPSTPKKDNSQMAPLPVHVMKDTPAPPTPVKKVASVPPAPLKKTSPAPSTPIKKTIPAPPTPTEITTPTIPIPQEKSNPSLPLNDNSNESDKNSNTNSNSNSRSNSNDDNNSSNNTSENTIESSSVVSPVSQVEASSTSVSSILAMQKKAQMIKKKKSLPPPPPPGSNRVSISQDLRDKISRSLSVSSESSPVIYNLKPNTNTNNNNSNNNNNTPSFLQLPQENSINASSNNSNNNNNTPSFLQLPHENSINASSNNSNNNNNIPSFLQLPQENSINTSSTNRGNVPNLCELSSINELPLNQNIGFAPNNNNNHQMSTIKLTPSPTMQNNNNNNINNNNNNNNINNNLPSFLQLPSQPPPQLSPQNIPNLCEVTIKDQMTQYENNSNNNSNVSQVLNTDTRRTNPRRDHAVSMYNASTKPNIGTSRYGHSRSRSTTYSHSSHNSIPGSFSAFCDPNDTSITFIKEEENKNENENENNNNKNSNEKEKKSINISKSGNRGFLINKQERRTSRLSSDSNAMNLFFGQSDDSSFDYSQNINMNFSPTNISLSTTNDSINSSNNNEGSDLCAMYSKDDNSLIMNACVVPINEPPIPSLDKKPFRGKTLRWVINVNCYYK